MPSLVIIETPWAELGAGEHARNYFRNAMRDALTYSNEIPWSRQALFYNGVLDFSDFEQVAESYELAQKAITCCDTMILYVDKGESRAMKSLANFAITQRKTVIRRTIYHSTKGTIHA